MKHQVVYGRISSGRPHAVNTLVAGIIYAGLLALAIAPHPGRGG